MNRRTLQALSCLTLTFLWTACGDNNSGQNKPPSTPSNSTTDVVTYHNDIARTGQNLNETVLTTGNVTSAKFGKLGFYFRLDGLVDAQPLYASNVAVPSNGTHNLVDRCYRGMARCMLFDADSGTTIFWHASMLESGRVDL